MKDNMTGLKPHDYHLRLLKHLKETAEPELAGFANELWRLAERFEDLLENNVSWELAQFQHRIRNEQVQQSE